MAEASSLSRRNTARLCSTATSMSGWPGPQRGQSRPPLQVCLHTGQIFSTRRAYPPARRAVKADTDCGVAGRGGGGCATAMPPAFDFFYDLGSPYSYLASTQLRGLSERTGATARLIPITLGGLRKTLGTVLPSTAQLAYMSQDVQLWGRRYRVPIQIPEGFPTRSIQALRACVIAEGQGRQAEVMQPLFAAGFG